MKIELFLKYDNAQYLGMINDKPLLIIPDIKLVLNDNEWNLIKDRQWNKYLIEKGFLTIKKIEKIKKIDKMEKDIEKGKLNISE